MSAGLSAALACLLFVAAGWGNRWSATFPPAEGEATKCSIRQDGLYCRSNYYSRSLPLSVF